MISFLRGVVAQAAGNQVVVDVNGVGYSVSVTPQALARLRVGEECQLSVAMIVREDSMSLYGFADEVEREVFELLQTVSGIGPKLAQTILAATTAGSLTEAIAAGDEAALVRIPGVGKKSAARLIVELGDRLPAATPAASTGWQSDVQSALESLGWSSRDAASAVEQVAANSGSDLDTASALKLALAVLTKGRKS